MKKNLLKILPFTILLFAVLGCSAIKQIKEKVEETQKPKVLDCTDGKCRLTVPGSWKIEKDLNNDANFQAANALAEQYAIVISESKQDFTGEMSLDDYVELITKDIETRIDDAAISETKSITINGYPAKQFEVSGSVDKIKAKWIYTFVDAPKNFHQILVWTLASKFDSNKPVLLDVVNSFKETEGALPPVSSNKN
ncbi:MAG: hypothetical protein ACR2F2_10235 [Pyrinomonadaceae bacterium]